MESEIAKREPIVFTNKAKCLDCNRCVRVCPVKAIKMKDGQAQVQADRCIVCGTCIRECPQGAKTYRNDTEKVKELLRTGKRTAAIIAPSIVSVYDGWKAKKIPSVLRKLGFTFIVEAAITVESISKNTKNIYDNQSNAVLSSSCPAFVNYIEKYRPDLIKNLANVCSPMVATAKINKKYFGLDVANVFIGPCIAKKQEAERLFNSENIHSVLTFQELNDWMTEQEIDLSEYEDSGYDLSSSRAERLFPLSGGLYENCDIKPNMLSDNNFSVSGYDEIVEITNDISIKRNKLLVEPLFCKYGCINGPASATEESIYERKRRVAEYSKEAINNQQVELPEVNMMAHFSNEEAIFIPKFSEDDILTVLDKIGKANPEDRLDCTSCGYPSCKDKAIAVLCGMAEVEMCVPWMRKKTKLETDKIIENSPNGIVMLNDKYEIINLNSAFRNMFMCSNSYIGKPISLLMDPEPFVKVATGEFDVYDTTTKHERYNLICQEITYTLKNEKKYVGIFVNLTNTILNKTKLDEIKRNTIMKANELLEHQIDMAQKIAKLLGESTARGEELVSSLMDISEDKKNQDKRSYAKY